jgi:pterin-4a-carbinolamine dehydratase
MALEYHAFAERVRDTIRVPGNDDRFAGPGDGRPATLSAEEVHDRLSWLPDWSGDEHTLTRTLAPPQEELGGLLQHLEGVLEVSGHGGRIHQGDGQLTVELWTASANGVTSYDVALAQRIDHMLLDLDATVMDVSD